MIKPKLKKVIEVENILDLKFCKGEYFINKNFMIGLGVKFKRTVLQYMVKYYLNSNLSRRGKLLKLFKNKI